MRLLLEGRPLAELRRELALTVVDERRVMDYVLHLAAMERRGAAPGQQGPAVKAVQRGFGLVWADLPPPEPRMPWEVAEALTAARTCTGLHIAPEQPGHRRLNWSPYTSRMTRVRILAHTCEECAGASYELCAAGGLMFIRRTDRTHARPVESVTEHLPARRMLAVWTRLLAGQAR